MAGLAALDFADDPALWTALGFTVEGGVCDVGGVLHRLGAPGKGIVAATLSGLPAALPAALATIFHPSGGEPSGEVTRSPVHPNGVIALDHLVVSTPDLDRTIGALEETGIELRRTRDAGARLRQAFFKLGDVVLEVVGPPVAGGDGSPSFWGLAYTVADLDATSAYLGERLRPAKDAVQPGRRIATLDRSVGSTVPIAFMSR